MFCFLGTGVLLFSCPVQNFFCTNSIFSFSFKDQFLKNNRKIRILRECCLPWCHVCFSMKIILFVYFFPKVVGMPPFNIHTWFDCLKTKFPFLWSPTLSFLNLFPMKYSFQIQYHDHISSLYNVFWTTSRDYYVTKIYCLTVFGCV